ncbi:unnamed protein product [Brachionus calyciflorus]|uniref:Uncharacterized protein n=1 Tax=Brachionus calyciflorus TaxID=104777 RepID=A0A813W714_9BILA|nr:unnamed protein product [Brachionus calyciflorus]
METESLNLIVDMAKTANLLANQLMQLHKNLQTINSTPKHKVLIQTLTPISSGYNSVKASCENLSILSNTRNKCMNYHQINSSIFNSTTTSDLESSNLSLSSTSSKLGSSFAEMEAQSIKRCLIYEETLPCSESKIMKLMTPFKKELPEIPRIKEIHREKSKQKSKDFFSFKKRKIIKCLNMSTSSM